MAEGKFQKWLESGGLLLPEGWVRDSLNDEYHLDLLPKHASRGIICNRTPPLRIRPWRRACFLGKKEKKSEKVFVPRRWLAPLRMLVSYARSLNVTLKRYDRV